MAKIIEVTDKDGKKWLINTAWIEMIEGDESGTTVYFAFRLPTSFMIDNAPTMDAVEVVHGMWEERRFICMDSEVMLGYRCSKCMLTFDAETNYCPNCGAKMDGGDEDG